MNIIGYRKLHLVLRRFSSYICSLLSSYDLQPICLSIHFIYHSSFKRIMFKSLILPFPANPYIVSHPVNACRSTKASRKSDTFSRPIYDFFNLGFYICEYDCPAFGLYSSFHVNICLQYIILTIREIIKISMSGV